MSVVDLVPTASARPSGRTPWQPLLTGAAADHAIAVAKQIGTALVEDGARAGTLGPWLAGGTTGIALFFTTLGQVTGDQSAIDHAALLVDDVVEYLGEADHVTADLYGGLPGVGWGLSRLEGRLIDADPDESVVDDYVTRLLTQDGPWTGSFDLIHGLAGLGVYALDRLPRASARHQLDLVVGRLTELIEVEGTSPGRTWRTQPSPLFTPTSMRYPDGHYDIGLAHGVCGPIAFLADALIAVPDLAGVRPLLDDALAWLHAHHLDERWDSHYPSMVGPGDPLTGTRTAWCYGDPGVAASLLAAGRALGDDALVDEAREVALSVANHNAECGQIEDAGICHGSMGLAHVLNCLGQDLGDERLLALARTWVDHAIEHRLDGEPLAGFPIVQRRYGPGYDGTPTLAPSPGVLEGAAGTGLALLTAASSVEPWWDGFLLTRNGASSSGGVR